LKDFSETDHTFTMQVGSAGNRFQGRRSKVEVTATPKALFWWSHTF